jgi:hypothetical protein
MELQLGNEMNSGTTQPGLNGRGLRLLLGFVTLGFVLSLTSVLIASHFDSFGIPLALAIILLGPPAVWFGAVGLRHGVRHLSSLFSDWTVGHWLIFLLFVSTLVFRIRDVQAVESDPVDAWSLLRLGPEAVAGGILLMQLISRGTPWLKSLFHGLFKALALYGLVCVLSSTWSVYGSWTLYKSMEFLLDVSVFAMILARVQSLQEFRKILNWTWALYGLELVWTWMGVAIWRGDALDDMGRLYGVWPVVASNSIGVSGAIISIVALSRFLSRSEEKADRSWYAVMFAFGMISLIASQTRNSMAGFIFGAFLVLLYQRRIWIGVVTTALTVPLLLLTSLGPTVGQFLARDQSETQLEGLSSRMDWWSFAWQQFMHHPVTGLGAYAAGKFAVLGKLGVGTASQMHSDWMEIIAGSSIWGLIPFTIALLGCWSILVRSYWDRSLTPGERELSSETLGVLGVITLRSFFNVELSWHAPFLYLAVVMYAEFLRRKREQPELSLNRSFVELQGSRARLELS